MRRVIAVLLVTTFIQACTAWRDLPLEPQRFHPPHNAIVRLTLVSGEQLTIKNPLLSGDSLIWNEPRPAHGAVPLAQIRSVQVLHDDGASTVAFVFLFGGIIAVALGTTAREGAAW